jgi:uncharacterized protein YgfB (UPF0149 family)
MQKNISIPFHQFANAMVTISALGSPSGLHGWLTGYLSTGARLPDVQWQIEAENYLETPETLPKPVQSLMTVFYGWVLQGLKNESMNFTLFLPESDDAELSQQVDAMAQWCKGFLDGFGAAGKISGKLDAETREVLQHFDAFSQVELTADDSPEDSEDLLHELVEHARVAALTVFLAFNQPDAGATKIIDENAASGPDQLH